MCYNHEFIVVSPRYHHRVSTGTLPRQSSWSEISLEFAPQFRMSLSAVSLPFLTPWTLDGKFERAGAGFHLATSHPEDVHAFIACLFPPPHFSPPVSSLFIQETISQAYKKSKCFDKPQTKTSVEEPRGQDSAKVSLLSRWATPCCHHRFIVVSTSIV